jgi:N-acetyl-gamma-glutamyl-phosphate reductase
MGQSEEGADREGFRRRLMMKQEPCMTATIFIDGEAGTTGLGIRERLATVNGVKLVGLSAQDRKIPAAKLALMRTVDLVILCLPDEAAKETAALVESLRERAPKLLDASSAHRVAPGWTYGFGELEKSQKEAIATARLVANPGCYATGAIALLRPLINAGLIAPDWPVSINAVSGFSGGGRSMIAAYEAHSAPNFELYALGLTHKHMPEIVTYSGLSRRPIFVPSVGNFRQGMLVSIPLHLDLLPSKPTGADIEAALMAHYRDAPAIAVMPTWPDPRAAIEAESLNHTDRMELRVFGSEPHHQAVLVAKLDNLGKGASGAAVQNLKLMLGLPHGAL